MAKKTASARGAGARKRGAAASPAAGKRRTAAKAPRGGARTKPTNKPVARAAAKPAAARGRAAKAASSAPARKILPRRQPETLRCKAMSLALTADDIERSVRFYVDGLGFHVKDRWERDGKLWGVEMLAGAAMIGLSQDDWSKGRDRKKGVGMRIYLETSLDVDEVAARWKARGVEVDGPLDTPWGAKAVHVTDPDGFQLTLYRAESR